MTWLREPSPDVASEKILQAAEKAFIELGVSATGMTNVAELAGCSRGTLYRYFKTRHELHVAYIGRAAKQIVERVRARIDPIENPRERLVEGILASVSEVRQTPGTAVWFEPAESGATARISRSAEVMDAFTTAYVSGLVGAAPGDGEARLRARWVVRVILSLLSMPGEDDAEERAIVERFATAALL